MPFWTPENLLRMKENLHRRGFTGCLPAAILRIRNLVMTDTVDVGFYSADQSPRRMWAGSDIEFIRPLVVGEKVVRRSNFDSVVHKQGRTGNLVFVKLRHEYSIREEICLCEIQTLVFRESQSG